MDGFTSDNFDFSVSDTEHVAPRFYFNVNAYAYLAHVTKVAFRCGLGCGIMFPMCYCLCCQLATVPGHARVTIKSKSISAAALAKGRPIPDLVIIMDAVKDRAGTEKALDTLARNSTNTMDR